MVRVFLEMRLHLFVSACDHTLLFAVGCFGPVGGDARERHL